MHRLSRLFFLTAICLLAASTAAHADTLHFALTDGTNNISFNIQTAPGTLTATTPSTENDVAVFYLSYVVNGYSSGSADPILFRGIGAAESFYIFNGSSPVISQLLPTIVTGTGSAPTFALGTFQLRNLQGGSLSASDFTLTITNLTPPPVSPTVTPEPSSFLLLGTGLASLAGVARRRFLSHTHRA